MSNNDYPPVVRAYRVVWRDRRRLLHATAARFTVEEKAQRFARLLRRDPAVTETKIMAVVLRPILPSPPAA
jgi:hypothetical protein